MKKKEEKMLMVIYMTIEGDVEMWLELIYHCRIIIQSF